MQDSTFDYYAAAINIELEKESLKFEGVKAKVVGKAWGYSRPCPLAIHKSKIVFVSSTNEFFGTILEKEFIPSDTRYQSWEFKSTQKTIQAAFNSIVK
jgi:hypothetical protein